MPDKIPAKPPLRKVVFDNLDNAKENGCFEDEGSLHGLTSEEIAWDLIEHASDCERLTARVLVPYVEEWLRERLNA